MLRTSPRVSNVLNKCSVIELPSLPQLSVLISSLRNRCLFDRDRCWVLGRTAFTLCLLCCRLANSEKQGMRTHAVSVSGKDLQVET